MSLTGSRSLGGIGDDRPGSALSSSPASPGFVGKGTLRPKHKQQQSGASPTRVRKSSSPKSGKGGGGKASGGVKEDRNRGRDVSSGTTTSRNTPGGSSRCESEVGKNHKAAEMIATASLAANHLKPWLCCTIPTTSARRGISAPGRSVRGRKATVVPGRSLRIGGDTRPPRK
jgi:hypothetical protein